MQLASNIIPFLLFFSKKLHYEICNENISVLPSTNVPINLKKSCDEPVIR